ncbi:leucine--tRNA ligase [candidate division TA06 bacterium]|uniref:Leucine--tRNA ligase n=1 Tax=candidate division TA06 bacterium TaxID=2250710 RepID=A0A933IA66_UNCT6|nr:leucine--tRNA ligase [candidate division TA06 bacterium]
MNFYDPKSIEPKWQTKWEEEKVFKTSDSSDKPKYYALEMFPYPSGSGLHVGHLKNYVPMDAFCRYKSMKGFNVLHPMGWDAFGQPAENAAVAAGRNPREMVPEYAANYKRTLKLAGCSYDWDREFSSSQPEFYRWTQWFFLLLYKKGLAYRATAPINWCPQCKTGLANEEVQEGRCWRCDSLVEKRPMMQWFFRITAYADRLLQDLDSLDWSAGMKEMQRDWIGRSEGAEVEFRIQNSEFRIQVFTTRPDTLFGATFMVLAPEHPLVKDITAPGKMAEVEAYIKKAKSETEMDRLNAERAKTGIFTGAYAVNPVNNKEIPVWIADYVMMGYGTGAIMCVPGHDARDFEFARKFNLPIIQVVSKNGKAYELAKAKPEEGIAVNSGQYDGLKTSEFKISITKWLEEQNIGHHTVNYRLRDWLISRQRYWGAPIPIVHCPKCGEVPVPEEQLPVTLPEVENYKPTGTGESPLAAIPEFVNTKCPKCGTDAKRETDTMGGYACSSWYFFRFADPNNDREFASKDKMAYWMPVDLYAGGIEHARSHLLYARFWTKVLYDEGYIGFQESFRILKNQGSLLAYTPGRKPKGSDGANPDEGSEKILDWIVLKPEDLEGFPKDQIVWRWARMSKSKGNVVTPEEIAHKYGVDSLRIFEMFVAPFEDDVQWSEESLNGSYRFLNRTWKWLDGALQHYRKDWREALPVETTGREAQVRRKLHQTIRKVGGHIDGFQFNTAIAALMELLNEIYDYWQPSEQGGKGNVNESVLSEILENMTLMLAPFAPHMAEELWEAIGGKGTIYKANWPIFDANIAKDNEITLVIQVNGKVRDKMVIPANSNEDIVKAKALENKKIEEYIRDKTIVKALVIQGKLINIVVK